MYLAQKIRDWQSSRRLTALMLLVMSVLMIWPVALPVGNLETELGVEGKDRSEPFPCQNRPCGCKSAKQCWKKCCCFTNAQKLAWAKAHRVQPPAFVVQAAQRETTQKAVAIKPSARKAPACCIATESRHSEQSHQKSPKSPAARTGNSASKNHFVIGIQSLQCQGIDQTVFGQLISIQPPAMSIFVFDEFDQGEGVSPLQCAPLIPCDQEPPTPPPRQIV